MHIDETAMKVIIDKLVDPWHKTFARDVVEMYLKHSYKHPEVINTADPNCTFSIRIESSQPSYKCNACEDTGRITTESVQCDCQTQNRVHQDYCGMDLDHKGECVAMFTRDIGAKTSGEIK